MFDILYRFNTLGDIRSVKAPAKSCANIYNACLYQLMLYFWAFHDNCPIQMHREAWIKFNIGSMGKNEKCLHDNCQTFTDVMSLGVMILYQISIIHLTVNNS